VDGIEAPTSNAEDRDKPGRQGDCECALSNFTARKVVSEWPLLIQDERSCPAATPVGGGQQIRAVNAPQRNGPYLGPTTALKLRSKERCPVRSQRSR
jgi:hypothetical protein